MAFSSISFLTFACIAILSVTASDVPLLNADMQVSSVGMPSYPGDNGSIVLVNPNSGFQNASPGFPGDNGSEVAVNPNGGFQNASPRFPGDNGSQVAVNPNSGFQNGYHEHDGVKVLNHGSNPENSFNKKRNEHRNYWNRRSSRHWGKENTNDTATAPSAENAQNSSDDMYGFYLARKDTNNFVSNNEHRKPQSGFTSHGHFTKERRGRRPMVTPVAMENSKNSNTAASVVTQNLAAVPIAEPQNFDEKFGNLSVNPVNVAVPATDFLKTV